MEDKKERLTIFFDEYAARFNKALKGEASPDIEGTVKSFAHYLSNQVLWE